MDQESKDSAVGWWQEHREHRYVQRLLQCYYRILRAHRRFSFRGETYGYFIHRYNKTWANERTVEIPIAHRVVSRHEGKRILEVGNVLSYYFRISHDVLDKHEEAPGVINLDILNFDPSTPYDLILSISTLEHIGWNEEVFEAFPESPDTSKILRTIGKMRESLAPEGLCVFTVPMGYNPGLDALLREGRIEFTEAVYMKRVSVDNRWCEVDWRDIEKARYGSPYPQANGLVVGFIEK